ncbi:MAG: glycosyltransferase family 2 protein [Simkania negevensis]|nr:glycosyltransferase family 2 protein [Simkania negevensis]
MKKRWFFLSLVFLLLVSFFFLPTAYPLPSFSIVRRIPSPQFNVQKKLGEVHPVKKEHSFVIFLIGHNHAALCERALCSIFTQTYPHYRLVYIDNGSTDDTYQKVEGFLAKEGKKDKVLLKREEKKRPEIEILYEEVHRLKRSDIVILLKENEFLLHENVLDHLHCAYANPEVWVAYGQTLFHPDYQKVEKKLFSDEELAEKKWRKERFFQLPSLKTFYAGMFQEIKLEDLLYQGEFFKERGESALFLPMMDMAASHLFAMEEILSVIDEENKSRALSSLDLVRNIENYLQARPMRTPLSYLSLEDTSRLLSSFQSDLLIFSEDHPLELYACLESFSKHLKDLHQIFVLYRSSDAEIERGYLHVQKEFPSVLFLLESEYPESDFKSLFSKIALPKRHTPSFLLVTEDRAILEKELFLHECVEALEKAHADLFFLPMGEFPSPFLKSTSSRLQLGNGIFACQKGKEGSNLPYVTTLSRKTIFAE